LKYWRRITVDGIFYRWLVEDVQTREDESAFQRSILILAEDHPGSKCVFVSAEIGRLRLWASSHPLVVRSRLVSACIRHALQNGWNPAEDGQEYRVELTAELLARFNTMTG
jgi:hypothetical protein